VKVLLTGGNGQVGTEVRKRLTGMELLAPGRKEFDLSRPQAVRRQLRRLMPDLILSVGAYTAVDRAEDEAEEAMAVNGIAVAMLAAYCQERGVPLIHLSTDYVSDGGKTDAYRPHDPPHPLGVYGASKLAGEVAARTAEHHLILRVAWVFSAHGNNFVKTMLRVGAAGKPLRIVNDQIGGPTWAGHIAEALVALVEKYKRGDSLPWGTYHFSGAPHVSWFDFAAEIFRQACNEKLLERCPDIEPINTSDYPTKARRPKNSCLSIDETERTLELPAPDWRVGLKETLIEIGGRSTVC
jgi:dTDP-4-dehydrorhamnose reductase